MPDQKPLLSQLTIGGVTYEIKDAVARQGGLVFHLATEASNTPAGVSWIDTTTSTTITGTLAAWNATEGKPQSGIYLVIDNISNDAQDVYGEWVAVSTGTTPSVENTSWEKLGDTTINWTELRRHLSATVNAQTTSVLGANAALTNADSATTMQYGTDTFVKSYPGTNSKLETTTITGVNGEETFDVVASKSDHTINNIAFGTATKASKIVTENKTATNLVLGTATTASKATAGTNVKVATKGTAVNKSYINSQKVLTNATYDSTTETLTIGDVNVTNTQIIPVADEVTITPYTFADVTVPVVTSNDSVSVASVKTNTEVTVPVISSQTDVNVSEITTASKTVAKKAAAAITVATGSLDANDASGATIMTGLGTAVTGTAIDELGSGSNTANGTAAAQVITIGSGSAVDVLNSNTTVTINVSDQPINNNSGN